MNIIILLLAYMFGKSSREDEPYHHNFDKYMK